MAWKAVITFARIGFNTVIQAYEHALHHNRVNIPPPISVDAESLSRVGAKSIGWIPIPFGKKAMSAEEAKSILGLNGTETVEQGWEKFQKLYSNNAPEKGGSVYVQSKIYTAYITMGPNLGKPPPGAAGAAGKQYWKTSFSVHTPHRFVLVSSSANIGVQERLQVITALLAPGQQTSHPVLSTEAVKIRRYNLPAVSPTHYRPATMSKKEVPEVFEPKALLEIPKGTPIKSLNVKDDQLICLHVNDTINIWDMKKLELEKSLTLENKVHMVELRMDFLYIAMDKTITTWDRKGHTEWITRFAISGGILYTASNDKTVKAWNIKDGQCLATYSGHRDAVSCMEVLGNTLITGSVDRTLRSWRAAKENSQHEVIEATHEFVGHLKLIFNIKIVGSTVYSASMDGTIRLWDMKTGTLLHVHKIDATVSGFRVDFKLSTDEETYLWSTEKHSIYAWNFKTGKFGQTFQGHRSDIKTVKKTEEYLFSGAEDREVRQWNLKDGQCILIMKNPGPITSISLQDDRLYAGGDDGNIRCWSIVTSDVAPHSPASEEAETPDKSLRSSKTRTFSSIFRKSPKKSSRGSVSTPTASETYTVMPKKQLEEAISNAQAAPNAQLTRNASQSSTSNRVETAEEDDLVGWYMGNWSRERAEEALAKTGANCLVVRSSSIPGCFALTKYFHSTQAFQHLLIVSTEGKFFIKDSFDHTLYSSLWDLVSHSAETQGFSLGFEEDDDG